MLRALQRASDACYAPARPVATRRQAAIRAALELGAVLIAFLYLLHLLRPMRKAHAPPPIPADTADARFGVPEPVRRRVFLAIADRLERDRPSSVARFFAQPWSIDDDLAGLERDEAYYAAGREKLTTTQIYLILDEGIRAHWPTSSGRPLPTTIAPLRPRQR